MTTLTAGYRSLSFLIELSADRIMTVVWIGTALGLASFAMSALN